jgi:hypothetical protein
MHKIKYKINRIKYYFKLIEWAIKYHDQIKNYKFLIELKDRCHNNYLEAERINNETKKNKAKIQEELLDNILNYVKI